VRRAQRHGKEGERRAQGRGARPLDGKQHTCTRFPWCQPYRRATALAVLLGERNRGGSAEGQGESAAKSDAETPVRAPCRPAYSKQQLSSPLSSSPLTSLALLSSSSLLCARCAAAAPQRRFAHQTQTAAAAAREGAVLCCGAQLTASKEGRDGLVQPDADGATPSAALFPSHCATPATTRQRRALVLSAARQPRGQARRGRPA